MKRRTTQATIEILEILESSGSALSHDMIQERITENIDRATIYRVLNRLNEDGKVHKIVGDDNKQYFALCSKCNQNKKAHSHDHVHFRCLECTRVECLDGSINSFIPQGYVAKIHNLVISGLCKECS